MIGYDLAPLYAAAATDAALCTLVRIEGSFSRRLGAQLAVSRNGDTVGSLSDGCLERQLVAATREAWTTHMPAVMRFGAGSPMIDFRLPCGGGLDILVDPLPDRAALRQAKAKIAQRKPATVCLNLPRGVNADLLGHRVYQPPLRILAMGEGPELVAIKALAHAIHAQVHLHDRQGRFGKPLCLGRTPDGIEVDSWTAILLLFHDHEWERSILSWAVDTPAFYIGAQGGAMARMARIREMMDQGISPQKIEKIRSPVGLIPHARDPEILALSVLAEIMAAYERLRSL